MARGGSSGPSWADLSEDSDEDNEEDEENDGQEGDEEGDVEGENDEQPAKPASEEELNAAIAVHRNVIRQLRGQGLGPGSKAFDGAQQDLDRLLEDLQALRPANAKPSWAALRRAKGKLHKAELASAALDQELEEIEQDFRDKLLKFRAKAKGVESRLRLHQGKVAQIEADIGDGRGVSTRAKRALAEAATNFHGLVPQVHAMLQALEGLPGSEKAVQCAHALQTALGLTYNSIAEVAPELLGRDGEEADGESLYSDEDEDDDEQEEEEDDEDELLEDEKMPAGGGAGGASATGVEAPGGASSSASPAAVVPAEAASQGAEALEGAPAERSAPPAVEAAETPTKGKTKAEAGGAKARAVAAGRKGKALVDALRAKRAGKVGAGGTACLKGPKPTVGGATAPMPAADAMDDTSQEAQELPSIVVPPPEDEL